MSESYNLESESIELNESTTKNDKGKTTDIKNANDNIASGSNTDDTVVQALSLNERKIYDKLDDDVKRFFLESITKARNEGKELGVEEGMAQGIEEGKAQGIEEGKAQGIEEGMAQGIEKERKKSLLRPYASITIFSTIAIDLVIKYTDHENFVSILNGMIFLLQIFWSFLLVVRESPKIRKYRYYTATIAPLLLGAIIAAILIGVHITPTVALPWAGVGVICSNVAKDFFALVIEA